MALSTPAVVDYRLGQLDSDDLTAFVADLWSARGYETRQEDRVVVATGRGESVVLAVVGGRGFGYRTTGDRSPDVVIAPRGGRVATAMASEHDARLVDAAALRERLWYSVDRSVANQLAVRHLGAPLDALRPPLQSRIRIRMHAYEPPIAPAAVLTAVVVLVAVGVVGAMALVGPLDGTDAAQRAGVFGGGSGGNAGDEGAVEAQANDSEGSVTESSEASETYTGIVPIPGVSANGIENVSALAAAHETAISGRSYTLWLDSYRPRAGEPGAPRIQRDTDITVAGGRYLVETELVTSGTRQSARGVYYDGDDWFVVEFVGGLPTYDHVAPHDASEPVAPDPFVLRRTLVTQYLSTPETAVTGRIEQEGRRLYRIEGSGVPPALAEEGIQRYEFVALVDSEGFVHDAEIGYSVVTGHQAVFVRFEWTYGRINETAVEPPTWYEEQLAGIEPENAIATFENTAPTTESSNATSENANATSENANATSENANATSGNTTSTDSDASDQS